MDSEHYFLRFLWHTHCISYSILRGDSPVSSHAFARNHRSPPIAKSCPLSHKMHNKSNLKFSKLICKALIFSRYYKPDMPKVFHFENKLIIKHFQKEVFFCRKIVVRIVGGFKNSHYFCRENPRDAEILSADISLQISRLRRLRLNSRNAPFVPYKTHIT